MTAPRPGAAAAQAADWFVRRQDGGWTRADERAFQAWLQVDPAHGPAYSQLSRTWSDFSHVRRPALAADAAPRSGRPAAPSRDAGTVRGRFFCSAMPWRAGAAAALASCLLAVVGWTVHAQTPSLRIDVATARGEVRTVTLPDGSTLTLNVATRLQARYYPYRREVTLQQGEAFFDVAPDAGRPFTVAAGRSAVRVLGTRFDVRAAASGLRVDVLQGRVEVRPDSEADAAVVLTARQGLRWDAATGAQRRVEHADDAIAGWRSGQLVFRRAPLSEVAEELSRYLDAPVTLSGPRLAHLRVSGFAAVAAPQAFLEALPDLIPVRVEHTPGGYQVTAR